MNNITKITWALNDYCSYQCDYCPTKFRGGGEPPETKEYIRVANIINENYKALNRTIEWTIDGGEPLDLNDIVTILKACKAEVNRLTLHTNGGKLWMDWWAIEPNIDSIHLTYHHWQNESLMDYIVQIFTKKDKPISLHAPVHPNRFHKDMARISDFEERHGIWVNKQALYVNADTSAGLFDSYTSEQLAAMEEPRPWLKNSPPPTDKSLVQEKEYFEETTWHGRYQDTLNTNPSYTGKMCNMGIETLYIGHQGWVSGASCNNRPLGNIWHDGWHPPNTPHKCGMIVCSNEGDRAITKFD